MSNPAGSNNNCSFFVDELFDLINAQRKLLRKAPVEDRAMSSRCTLRFAVVSKREVDFNADRVEILPHEVDLLEKMINDQFGVYFEGEINKLCAKSQQKKEVPVVKPDPILQISPGLEFEKESGNGGFVSMIKRMFGR